MKKPFDFAAWQRGDLNADAMPCKKDLVELSAENERMKNSMNDKCELIRELTVTNAKQFRKILELTEYITKIQSAKK